MCLTTKVEKGKEQTVFINYYKEDGPAAQRLYSDLKAANLNPWIDKENILPGQIKDTEIEKAIKSSRYFVALLSTRSAGERGDAQKQINKALDVRNEFSLSQVFFIPARLNEIELPFELSEIQLVDMFPDWEDGLKKILKSMKVEQNLIESVIEHQSTISPFTSLDVSHEVIKTQLFKGARIETDEKYYWQINCLKFKMSQWPSKETRIGIIFFAREKIYY